MPPPRARRHRTPHRRRSPVRDRRSRRRRARGPPAPRRPAPPAASCRCRPARSASAGARRVGEQVPDLAELAIAPHQLGGLRGQVVRAVGEGRRAAGTRPTSAGCCTWKMRSGCSRSLSRCSPRSGSDTSGGKVAFARAARRSPRRAPGRRDPPRRSSRRDAPRPRRRTRRRSVPRPCGAPCARGSARRRATDAARARAAPRPRPARPTGAAGKTAKNESPSVLTTRPSFASTADRTMS